jgi:hypothetical protein
LERVVIGFIPPIKGVNGVFNTFRMGKRYASLAVGEEVFLMDEKRKVVFGRATVLDVTVGPLSALCACFAFENHTQLDEQGGHADRLFKVMQRIYGPHIATPTKTATVVRLRRVMDEIPGAQGQL